MVSGTMNVADIQQTFMNNITQVNEQFCIATVDDTENNNIIIFDGKVNGSFTGIATTISTDATCQMTSTMEDSIENILDAIINQTNNTENDIFGDFTFNEDTNVFNIRQTVINNISQINLAVCAANTTLSKSNNLIYVQNGARINGDFVGLATTSNTSASCNITNYMKNATYNQGQASGTQKNIIKGMFVALLTILAAIIGIIVIGVIILFATGAIGYSGYKVVNKDGEKSGTGPAESSEDQQLKEAEALGITPNTLAQLNQQEMGTQYNLPGGFNVNLPGNLTSNLPNLSASFGNMPQNYNPSPYAATMGGF